MTEGNEYLEPLEIDVKRADGYMLIKWNDGHAGRDTFLRMRWNCPCASCNGEMGVPGRLEFVKELKDDETVLENLEPIGYYALRPTWKDGHDSGLFTYELLRNLCECEICMNQHPDKFQNNRLVERPSGRR